MIKKKTMVKRIYHNPEVYYGKGSVSILKSIECSRILFLVSGSVQKTPLFEKVRGYFEGKEAREEVVAAPAAAFVVSLVQKYASGWIPEVIIAVGGGKVLDTAKVVRVMLDNRDVTFDYLKQNQFVTSITTKLVAVPTTPGTGSETNPIAVIKDQAGIKMPYINQGFVPDVAILDNGFMETLGEKEIYEFAADIFSHAAEGSVSVAGTPLLSAIATSSLKLLKDGFDKFKQDPKDPKGLSDVLYAGHLAGIVQGNAFVGVCHALAHTIEKQVKVSHGGSILLTLKPTLDWLKQATGKPEYDGFLAMYDAIGFDKYRAQDALKDIDKDAWADAALLDPSISTTPVRMKKDNILVLIDWILKSK